MLGYIDGGCMAIWNTGRYFSLNCDIFSVFTVLLFTSQNVLKEFRNLFP